MAPDASIHPSTDKSTVITLLEDLIVNDTYIILLRSLPSLKKDQRRVYCTSCGRFNGRGTRIDGSPELQDLQRACNILHHNC